MATRRTRSTTPTEDWQVLKLAADNQVISQTSSNDSQVVFRQGRKPPTYSILFGYQFDEQSVPGGIKLAARMVKNGNQSIHATGVQFTVWNVSLTAMQTETLLGTFTGTQNGVFYVADIPESSLSGLALDGEPVLLIEVQLRRFRKVYKTKFYVNDVGIWDKTERIRKRVNLMQADIAPASNAGKISN